MARQSTRKSVPAKDAAKLTLRRNARGVSNCP
jgi:hypothetical protein